MNDIFISHSSSDRELAERIRGHIEGAGLKCFMAPMSIPAGENWTNEILNQLKFCNTVIFIATPNSCASPYVNQELGGGLLLGKQIVPVTAEIPAAELPGWMKQFQCVEAKADGVEMPEKLGPVIDSVKTKKLFGWLSILGLIAAIVAFARRK